MSGLLGLVAAGAAKGFAEGQSRAVETQRKFDLSKELQAAELEMNMQLKRAGVEIEEQARDRERKKIEDVVTKAKKDPNEGKGGYVTPEMAEAEAKAADKRAADALFEQGYLDAGGKYLDKTTAADKAKLDSAVKNSEINKNNAYAEMYGKKTEYIDEEVGAKQTNASAAFIRANRPTGGGKSGGGGKGGPVKLTDAQAMWEDFKSKKPEEAKKTTFSEFMRTYKNQVAQGNQDKRITKREKGYENGKEVTTTTKVEPEKPSKPWERKY